MSVHNSQKVLAQFDLPLNLICMKNIQRIAINYSFIDFYLTILINFLM